MRVLGNLNALHQKLRENALMFDDCYSICTTTDNFEVEEFFREKAIKIKVIHTFEQPDPKNLPELQLYCDDCGIQPINIYDWATVPGELNLHIFTISG